jgi:hypothetical protein
VCAIRGTTWRRHASIQNKFTISITCLSGITLSVRRLGLPWCWWRNEMLPVAVATGYITLPALFSLLAGFHHVSINFMLCSAIRPVLYLAASQQHRYWLWHIGFGLIPFAQNPSSNLLLVTLLYPIPSVDLLPLWSWLRYDRWRHNDCWEGESKVDNRKYVGSGWPGAHISKHKGKAIN